MNKVIEQKLEVLYNNLLDIGNTVFNAQQKGLKVNTEIYVRVMDNLYNNTHILKEVLK